MTEQRQTYKFSIVLVFRPEFSVRKTIGYSYFTQFIAVIFSVDKMYVKYSVK